MGEGRRCGEANVEEYRPASFSLLATRWLRA